MNKANLIKLCDFLDELPKEKFNFSSPIEKWEETKVCPTVACAIGWCPQLFPEIVQWDPGKSAMFKMQSKTTKSNDLFDNFYDYDHVAAQIFEIHQKVAANLFTPDEQRHVHYDLEMRYGVNTPKEVSTMLRKFIELVESDELYDDGSGEFDDELDDD